VALPGRRVGDTVTTVPGGEVTVLLRPEQLAIDGPGVPACVRLVLEAGEELTARCPGCAVPEVGARVGVAVRGEGVVR
jgi:hypothetical protein